MTKTILATLGVVALLLGGLRAQDPKYNEFLEKLNKALEYNDEKGIDRVVRDDPEIALRHFNAIAWDWKAKQDEANRKVLDALIGAWGRTFKTRTLEYYERYISSRSHSDRDTLYKLEVAMQEVWALYAEAQKNKDRATFEAAAQGALNLARKFEEVGHPLFAAQLYSLQGEIIGRFPEPTVEDRKNAIAAIERFMEKRRSWEWTEDTAYKNNANWVKTEKARIADAEGARDKRKKEGYDPDAAGADALVMPGVEEAMHALTFEVMKKEEPTAFWMGGVTAPLWIAVQVVGTGPEKFGIFSRRDLYLVRPSGNKFGVSISPDPDMAKNPFVPISPSVKFKPSVFWLDENQKFPYAAWFYTAGEQEPLLGLSQNLAPQPDRAVVYYKSASSWTTEIAGEPVVFYDDNGNGKLFEENPWEFGYNKDYASGDVTGGLAMPAYDGMRIGKKGERQPFSQFAKIGDGWYHLRAGDGDDKVGTRPLNPEYFKTGTVKMKWKGGRPLQPEMLVLEGKGQYAAARFNVASGKEVEVPAGSYRLTFGRIVSGRGARAIQLHVSGGAMEDIEVKEGATTTFELGAPFRLDFKPRVDGDNIVVDSSTFVVRGAAGEIYTRINGAPLAAEVLTARAKSGKGARPVGEFQLMTLDALDALARKDRFKNLTVFVGFFPVPKGKTDTTELSVPKAGVAAIGLRMKKHKVFKKLDPIFHEIE